MAAISRAANLGLGRSGSVSISTVVQLFKGSGTFLAVPLVSGAMASSSVSLTCFRFSTTAGGRGGPPPFLPSCDRRR